MIEKWNLKRQRLTKALSVKMHLIGIIAEIFSVLVVIKMFSSNLSNHFSCVTTGRGKRMPDKQITSKVWLSNSISRRKPVVCCRFNKAFFSVAARQESDFCPDRADWEKTLFERVAANNNQRHRSFQSTRLLKFTLHILHFRTTQQQHHSLEFSLVYYGGGTQEEFCAGEVPGQKLCEWGA